MIKNLITNSSQGSDLLLKQNRRHFAAHSCIYREENYQFVSTFVREVFLRVDKVFLGLVGFHCGLPLKHYYLKKKSLNQNYRYQEINFHSSKFR